MSDGGSSSSEYPASQKEENDDSDEAEFEDEDDEDDELGNEFYENFDEYSNSSDGECGDTRVFEQMKRCRKINITNLSLAFYPSNFESKAGWRAFAVCLRSFDSAVEVLDVSDCNAHTLEYGETRALLNDDTLSALAESLATNSSLKTLKMNGRNCSSRGWTGFFNTYLHSQCSLEELHLSKDDIDDAGWRVLSRILCDKSSIERTYTSNHVLHTIRMIPRPYDEDSFSWAEQEGIPDDVSSLLRLNINRDKTGVAHQKILISSDSTNIQVLVGMSAPVLPCAIEWICRDRIGLSLMYSVVRGIPTLFEPKIL